MKNLLNRLSTVSVVMLLAAVVALPAAAKAKKPKLHKEKNGLKWVDVTVGTGEKVAAKGDWVQVHYTGKLNDENGKEFDSSEKSGKPFRFQVGVSGVIQGWQEGIPGMKEGGERRLYIPPDLGYGKNGAGPIPPDSTLYFDVKMLKIE